MSNQMEEIELNIQQAKEIIERGNALERLLSNRDFKKIIMEGYFRDEAVRLVHLKTDPNMQVEARQKSLLQQMDGIGCLNGYFTMIFQQADMASKAIEAAEEERDELINEGAE